MRKRLCTTLAAAALVTGSASAAVTVDGNRSAADGYQTALNSAAGVDTNTNFGFGDSAKSEQINSTSDSSTLSIFVEGSLHSGNKLFVLIDSDNSAATGFSANHPNGSFGESDALEFFNDFPAGGYDLMVEVTASGNPATSLDVVVFSYDTAGAIVDESYAGNIAGLTGSLADTIRGNNGNVQVGYITGDGAGNGIEIKIPKSWLLYGGATGGSYQLVALNGNGGNNFWSDSVIPQLAASGNIGFTAGADQDRLTALTAPDFAWPVFVDGAGDGDSNGVDDYDTITAAIVALGANSDDGLADIINVMVDSLPNHPGILINGTANAVVGQDATFQVFRDDVSINGDADGNGTDCVLRLAKGVAGTAANGYSFVTARFPIELDVDQKVAIRDFAIIPEPIAGGGTTASAGSDGGTRMNCIYVDESGATGATILNGAGVTLQNLVFVGSDPSGNPLSPTAAFASTNTYWASDASFVSVVAFASNNTGVNNFTHTIDNVTIGGTASTCGALGIFADAGTGAGIFNISNSYFTRAGRMLTTVQARVGLNISGAFGTTVNVTDTVCDNNQSDGISVSNTNTAGFTQSTTVNLTRVQSNSNSNHGLNVANTSTAQANTTVVNVNAGCQFKSNSFRGMSFSPGGGASGVGLIRVDITGTAAEPVVIESSGNRGLRTDLAASTPVANGTMFEDVEYLYIVSSGVYGMELNEFNFQYPTTSGPLFSNCLFADNGGVVTTTANIRIPDTNAAAGGVRFSNCTFHNPRLFGANNGRNIIVDFTGATLLTIDITDSILSGGNDGDIGIQVNNGSNNTVNVTNSALVAYGSSKLTTLTSGFPTAVVSGTTNTLNLTNVTNRDPLYASTTIPLTSSSFDVTSTQYATAGTGSTPLDGAFQYLGGAPAGALTFAPATYDFGAVAPTTTASSTTAITISNSVAGGEEVNLTALGITGTDSGAYAINPPVTLPQLLASGDSVTVTVEFTPAAALTYNDATLGSTPAATNSVDLDGNGGSTVADWTTLHE